MHLLRMGFTHIIFHTTFLSPRWGLAHFRELVDRARPLRDLARIKIALPQDEFLQNFGVSHVLRWVRRALQRLNVGSRPA